MELKITQKEEKPLLSRMEGIAEAKHKTTPSYAELKKEIASQLKTDENLIIIKRIAQKYGQASSEIKFKVYANIEALKKFERIKEEKKEEPKAEQSS